MNEEGSKKREHKVQKPSNGKEFAMSKEKKDGRYLGSSVDKKENGQRGGQRWKQEPYLSKSYRL